MNDLIDRQAAIATAISGRVRTLPTTEDGENWIRVNEVRDSLLSLPSAQPDEKRTEERTETHACDLISRSAAIDALCKRAKWLWDQYHEPCNLAGMIDAINDLPSAQPEIIRCKDCRYYQDNNGGYPHMNCKWDANETPDEDDFCSGAERRTDGF